MVGAARAVAPVEMVATAADLERGSNNPVVMGMVTTRARRVAAVKVAGATAGAATAVRVVREVVAVARAVAPVATVARAVVFDTTPLQIRREARNRRRVWADEVMGVEVLVVGLVDTEAPMEGVRVGMEGTAQKRMRCPIAHSDSMALAETVRTMVETAVAMALATTTLMIPLALVETEKAVVVDSTASQTHKLCIAARLDAKGNMIRFGASMICPAGFVQKYENN